MSNKTKVKYRTKEGDLVTKKSKSNDNKSVVKYKTVTPRKIVKKEKYITKNIEPGVQETIVKKKDRGTKNKYTKTFKKGGEDFNVYDKSKSGIISRSKKGVETSIHPTGLKTKDKTDKVYDKIVRKKGSVSSEDLAKKRTSKFTKVKKNKRIKKKYPLRKKDEIKPTEGKLDYRGMF
jgi:hypothetical protein